MNTFVKGNSENCNIFFYQICLDQCPLRISCLCHRYIPKLPVCCDAWRSGAHTAWVETDSTDPGSTC